MALPTPDQAQSLLNSGMITDDTFRRLIGNGAEAAGITPKEPFAPEAPAAAPPADPFPAAAAAAGISPPAERVYNDFGPITGIAGQPLPSAAPPAPTPPTPAAPIGPPTASGLPPGVTVEGGITLASKNPPPRAGIATPPRAPVAPDASREQVATGMGIPSLPPDAQQRLLSAVKDPWVRDKLARAFKC